MLRIAVRYSRLGLVAGLLLAAGCGWSEAPSSGAPPLVVCGTTLYSGAAGAILTVATPGMPAIQDATSGVGIYLQVSADCDHGAEVDVPAADGVITAVADAADHQPAAVAIQPFVSIPFTITVHPDGGAAFAVPVHLADSGLPTAASNPQIMTTP